MGLYPFNKEQSFKTRLVDIIPKLQSLAFAITGSRDDGDELVQATLERALDRRSQFENKGSLEGWVTSILRSQWKNELRSRSVRRGNSLTSVDHLEDHSHANDPMRSCSGEQLLEQVWNLPEHYRSVVVLIDVEGMSYREAATLLDIPIGTLMSRLSRARDTLLNSLTRPQPSTRPAPNADTQQTPQQTSVTAILPASGDVLL